MKPKFYLPALLCCLALTMRSQYSTPQLVSDEFAATGSTLAIDFDSDGDIDIIAEDTHFYFNTPPFSFVYWLYLNDGVGNYEEIQLLEFDTPVIEAWGDYNDDGLMDFIFSDFFNSNSSIQTFYVRWGEPNFGFSAQEYIFETNEPIENIFYPMTQMIAGGDVDNDGIDEFLISVNYLLSDPTQSYDHQGFYYSFNWNGNSFDEPQFVANSGMEFGDVGMVYVFRSLKIQDFDGDGLNDIVAFINGNFGWDIQIFKGLPGGETEEMPIVYPGGWSSYDFGNLDEDSENEVVVSFSTFMGRFGNGDVDLYEQDVFFEPTADLQIIDVNHDGLNDIAAIASNLTGVNDGIIYSVINNGDPASDWEVLQYDALEGMQLWQVTRADMNGDTFEDLIVVADNLVYVIYTESASELSANFSSDATELCGSENIQFSDESLGAITSWSWIFEGGNPATSSAQNPIVTYNSPGTYDVSLTVSDGSVEASIHLFSYVQVLPSTVYYLDNDADSFGNVNASVVSCEALPGYVTISGDCNDNSAAVNPSIEESCNGVDDDCDGGIDEGLLSSFYPDADGDGFGALGSATMACSAPSGYVSTTGDCNDNNGSIYPGAPELCNGVNDDCDASLDEGCAVAPANDNPSGAILLPVNAINVTTISVGNLTNATASSQSLTTAITGQDLWYRFIAPSPGIRIRVQSTTVNILVELQTMSGQLVDFENIKSTPGNEFLNFGNLTEGTQYRIVVRNYNSAQGTGSFTISLNFLNDSKCITVPGNYDYCQLLKALPVGAPEYRFSLTSNTTGLNYFRDQLLFTTIRMSTIADLPANDVYTVNVHSIYSLTNSLGAIEEIVIPDLSPVVITINPWTKVKLRDTDACPAILSPNATVALDQSVCRAVDYQWEFTSSTPGTLPVAVMRGSLQTNFPLSLLPAASGTTYSVRIRPKFSNGMFGDWGLTRCLQTSGVAGFILQDEEVNNTNFVDDRKERMFALYPNPVSAEVVSIRFSQLIDEVVHLRIVDLTGREVYSNNIILNGSTQYEIPTNVFGVNGVYLVEVKYAEKVEIEKLVVQF